MPAPVRAGEPVRAKVVAPTIVKAPAVTKKEMQSHDVDGSDCEEGGGVMTCANRDLLKQMLQGAVDEDVITDDVDERDAAMQMNSRFVPGTPKAGMHKRSVPTICSPSAAHPCPAGGTAVLHGVGAKPLSSAAPKAGAPRLLQTVVTGAPQPASASYVSVPRPGSRGACGGGAPAPQSPVGACSVQQVPVLGAKRVGIVQRPVRGASYADMHALRARNSTGTAVKSPAKAVAKPLSGPKAFDMLRRMAEDSTGPAAGGSEEGMGDAGGSDDGSFLMPGDIAQESEARDEIDTSVDAHDTLSGRPRPSPLAGPDSPPADPQLARISVTGGNPPHNSSSSSRSSIGAVEAGEADLGVLITQESAAEYVERMKRGFSLQQVASPCAAAAVASSPSTPSSNGSLVGAAPLLPPQCCRARSIEPKGSAGRSMAADAATGSRARSSEPRATMVAAAAGGSRAEPNSDNDSDDESITAVGAPAWKSDIRQLKSRPRPSVDGGGGPPRRPPRAPHVASAATPPAQPSSVQGDRRPSADPDEPLARRKPRIVDYTPATVEGYKQKYGQEAKIAKSLGPDLDDESLLVKKAVHEKVKQFSKELHKVNKQRTSAAPPRAPPPKPELKPSARSKALEFAKEVPKPRKSKSEKNEKKTAAATAAAAEPEKRKSSERTEADLASWDEIRQREKQHFEDVVRVGQIKDILSQLAF